MQRAFNIAILFFLITGMAQVTAQNANNPLLYSNQATMLGDQGSAFDPVSIIMPGTAYTSGFGSFIDNPASMAMQQFSFGEFGLSFRTVNEDARFLGNSRSLRDNQTNLSNAGFVYSFPTEQGSFVIGGGYTQHTNFNRALDIGARNENSTITDAFKVDGSPYQEIAFGTFATDYGDEFEDWDESIFRVGFDRFGDFLGVRQQGEILQSGHGGEYSMFFATEFQRNMMIGGSIGILSGRFHYDRIFQEIDEFNDYDGDFIDSNDDGFGDTDIDNIILDDELTSRYTGLRARLGAVYRVTDQVNVGVNHTFRTSVEIDEQFDATIRTTFNNGVEFSDFTDSDFSYKVRFPGRTSLGLSLNNMNGLSASLSTEYVNYSNTTIDFEDSALFEDERIENEFIENTFRSVWSFRGGIAYDLTPDFTIRGGYSYLPSRFIDGTDDRDIFSLGAGVNLTRDLRLELAAQYTMWDEVSTVYEYGQYDYSSLPDQPPSVNFRSEDANRSVDHWNFLGTLRFRL